MNQFRYFYPIVYYPHPQSVNVTGKFLHEFLYKNPKGTVKDLVLSRKYLNFKLMLPIDNTLNFYS